jgi:hypothetical protein
MCPNTDIFQSRSGDNRSFLNTLKIEAPQAQERPQTNFEVVAQALDSNRDSPGPGYTRVHFDRILVHPGRAYVPLDCLGLGEKENMWEPPAFLTACYR